MLAWIDDGCDKLCCNWWQSRGPNSVLFRATQQPTDLEVNHTQKLASLCCRLSLIKPLQEQGRRLSPKGVACKCGGLNKKLGMVVHACDPSTGKEETGGSLELNSQSR